MSDKKVTKKAQAFSIFEQEQAKRANGDYDTNKAFRAVVLQRMEDEIGVSRASAATMYNEAKKASGDDTLGRDPKKVTVKVNAPKTAPVEEVTQEETAEESA